MHKKVLILGEDTRSFLSVIRSLAKQEYIVDVVCFDASTPSLKSKYINEIFLLNYQAQEKCYQVIVPCDERSIFPLNENAQRFPKSTILAIPNQKVIDYLFDKSTTKALAEQLDIPVAKGNIVAIMQEGYKGLQSEFGDRFVIKPTLSFEADKLATRQAVGVIASQKDFERYTAHTSFGEQFLVESYFSGKGDGLSLLALDGEIQYAFAHTRVSEPRAGGGSSYRKAIPVDDDKLAACQKLCKATNYHGVGMFEYKTNPMTGEWILIEVNARFWGSLPLAIHAGIDFPALYIDSLLGKQSKVEKVVTVYNQRAYARSLSSDLFDSKAEFEFDRAHIGSAKAITNLSKRLFSYTRLLTQEKIDSYDSTDKQPFITECKQFFSSTLGDRLSRKKFVEQREKLNDLLAILYSAECPSIKFVCYGNIMRSPMAKESLNLLANQALLGWDIDSYGFHQNEDRVSPKECIEEAAKLGIDLSKHRSKCLRQSHLNAKEAIIFVFDEKNMNKLTSYYQADHVYNLAWFIPQGLGQHKEIEDPYGQGNEATAYCYLLVVEAVKLIFEEYLKIKTL
jgi:protein-tyrosine-phosphatase/predicted ATP-grasp superfamily ATP-dependent carboligase